MISDEEFAASLAAKSDQINAADLIGGPTTIKITKMKVTNADAAGQKWHISFEGSDKLYKPCLGMRRAIGDLWGKPPYTGRRLTLYRDPEVVYGKDQLGGIRISHASHIDGVKRVTVPVARNKVKTFTISPLPDEHTAPPAVTTPQPPANAYELAEAAASKGTDAFRAWWASDEGRLCRGVASEHMDALKSIAAKADAAAVGQDDGPPM